MFKVKLNLDYKNVVPEKVGVYKISSKKSKSFYIGSSVNLRSRFTAHILELIKGRHLSEKLSSLWKKQSNSMQFSVLHFCSKKNVRNKEQLVINKYKHDKRLINTLIKVSDDINKKLTPVGYLLYLFGGVRPAARVIGISPSCISKWQRIHKDGGYNRRIPETAFGKILKAAEKFNLDITLDDLIHGRKVSREDFDNRFGNYFYNSLG